MVFRGSARTVAGPASTSERADAVPAFGRVDLSEQDEARRALGVDDVRLLAAEGPCPFVRVALRRVAQREGRKSGPLAVARGSPHATAPKREWPPGFRRERREARRSRAPWGRELGEGETECPGPGQAVREPGIGPGELFFQEDGRDEAEPRAADGFGEGREREPELVGGLPDVVRDGPGVLEIADFRPDRACELRDRVAHHALVVGEGEGDHGECTTFTARNFCPETSDELAPFCSRSRA